MSLARCSRFPLAWASVALPALVACGHDPDEPVVPDGVVFEGAATDEAWIALDEATLVLDEARAPRLTAPASLSRTGAPPTFTWDGGAVAFVRRAPSGPRAHRARASLLGALVAASSARAHLPPVTGDIYRLTLSLGAGDPIRVLTTDVSWTPDSNAWGRIGAAAGPVTVELVGAHLMSNRVTEGPFASPAPSTIPFAE